MAARPYGLADEYLRCLLGDDILIAGARIFCRAAGAVEYKRETIERTMIGGVALADLRTDKTAQDQLILGQLIIVPLQIYTATSHEHSPARGMRMDQILSSAMCLEPEFWNKRLK